MDNKLPPPPNILIDNLPDYYLGYLLYYDDQSDDNCRWVVYDGTNKIRCPSRTAAINYITTTRNAISKEEIARPLTSSRLHLQHAINDLITVTRLTTGPTKMVTERLSSRLRPFLIELDNLILL